MRVGGARTVLLPPELAFGGAPAAAPFAVVPAGSSVRYEVELLRLSRRGPDALMTVRFVCGGVEGWGEGGEPRGVGVGGAGVGGCTVRLRVLMLRGLACVSDDGPSNPQRTKPQRITHLQGLSKCSQGGASAIADNCADIQPAEYI